MVTQQDAINIVSSFLADVKANGISINRAILFGSVAKNSQHEDSDIDLVMVSDVFQSIGMFDIPLFVKSLAKYYIIQPKTYSTEDFNEQDAFIQHILKTGIEIKV